MALEQMHSIKVGDTTTKLARTLQQKNAAGTLVAVNLTGLTLAFELYDQFGTDQTAAGTAAIVTAADGTVTYDFDSTDVDTAGLYFGRFVVTNAGETETFAKGRGIPIDITE